MAMKTWVRSTSDFIKIFKNIQHITNNLKINKYKKTYFLQRDTQVQIQNQCMTKLKLAKANFINQSSVYRLFLLWQSKPSEQ